MLPRLPILGWGGEHPLSSRRLGCLVLSTFDASPIYVHPLTTDFLQLDRRLICQWRSQSREVYTTVNTNSMKLHFLQITKAFQRTGQTSYVAALVLVVSHIGNPVSSHTPK